jgi:hypothetical protein
MKQLNTVLNTTLSRLEKYTEVKEKYPPKITPCVVIVLLNWNGYQDTLECIESLKKITYSNYKVVVVDNASSGDDIARLNEQIGLTILANNKNLGFPGGCNVGMQYAMGYGADYIVLLNNDTIVAPDFLAELVKTAESDKNIGIVGSTTYYYYQQNKIQYNGGKINWWLGINNSYLCNEIDNRQYFKPIERDYVPATSCLIKREVIEKVGYLDESYFFAIEEFDYCTRVKRAGYKVVYQPFSMIWHKWNASGKKVSKYPETEKLIRQKVGVRAYKLWWKLYKTYSPKVWFAIPFLLQVSFVGPLVVLMFKGEWSMIFKGITNRLGMKGE